MPLTMIPRRCLIYADEDKLDSEGFRTDPHFKPDWNWAALARRKTMFPISRFFARTCSSLLAFARILATPALMISSCVMARGSSGIISITSRTCSIIVRTVPQSVPERQRLVAGAIKSCRGTSGATTSHRGSDPCPRQQLRRRVRYLLRGDEPTVSIIIPTRDRVELLRAMRAEHSGEDDLLAFRNYPDR